MGSLRSYLHNCSKRRRTQWGFLGLQMTVSSSELWNIQPMGMYSRETILGYVSHQKICRWVSLWANTRSGIKGETMELSQGGVLVGKPKKGLQKYFHNVVPLAVGDYKGWDAKLPKKDFGNKTKHSLNWVSAVLCSQHGHRTLGKTPELEWPISGHREIVDIPARMETPCEQGLVHLFFW